MFGGLTPKHWTVKALIADLTIPSTMPYAKEKYELPSGFTDLGEEVGLLAIDEKLPQHLPYSDLS